MTAVHRLTKRKYAGDPLSGVGGLHAGGRWHHKGNRIVYCAESLSLASLEFLVNFGKLTTPIRLVAFEVSIPDDLVEPLDRKGLPKDWGSVPHPSGTADLGAVWLTSVRSAVLKVPSVVSPGEYNFLLNPAHPEFGRIKILRTESYKYDSRLTR